MPIAWMWASAAAAPTVDLVVEEGDLHPGQTAQVLISMVGGPLLQPLAPDVQVEGGRAGDVLPIRSGVWRVAVEPDPGVASITLVAESFGVRATAVRTVSVPALPPLSLPEVIDGSIRDGSVTFLVSGDDPPPLEALEVVSGEGSVADLRLTNDGVEVTLAIEDQPFPRVIPVGVRDRRGDLRPVWSKVRLRARPRIPLQAEPGASLTLSVGGRPYGPFIADASGRIDATVDQYPGERVAHGVFRDDLGNETRTDLPLVSPGAVTLAAFPGDEALPGRPPPLVYLAAALQDGSPWQGDEPTCRSPASDLPVRELEEGAWYAALPPLTQPEDVRVECTIAGTTRVFKVRVSDGVATDLRLRVWPEELRSDLPFAEVSAVLEDARGERLDTEGVRISAVVGQVTVESGGGIVIRGEYAGDEAIDAVADSVVAVFDPPPGEGAPRELELGWGRVPDEPGDWVVYARALDARRRPLTGVDLQLVAAGVGASVTTGLDGWATATLPVDAEPGAIALEARTDWVTRRTLVLPGESGLSGPGTPRLRDERSLSITPSRVAGISVDVDPAVLQAGPGAFAWVVVQLEDRAGRPIVDEPIELHASSGELGEVQQRPDGRLVASYEPDPSAGAGEVQITARTDSLRSTARLVVEPRIVQVSLGPWLGVQTNFGSVAGPTVGADLDVRTRLKLIGDSVLLRASVHGYGIRSAGATGVGSDVELRSSVIPITAALLFREDRGPWGFWGGGGPQLAVHRLEVRFGDDLVGTGTRALIGPALTAGGSRRVPGGELLFDLRASWLAARSEEVGYRGNVGGFSAGIGYRLLF